MLLFDRQGTVIDTARWESADENAVTYRLRGGEAYAPTLGPVAPIATRVAGRSVFVEWSVPEGSPDGQIDIRRVSDEDSSVVYSRNLRYRPIAVPGHVLDSLIGPRLEIARLLGVIERELERALRDAVRLPDDRPPIRTVRAGDDGTLWLQLNMASADSLTDWVLIGADGSPRGRVRLPLRSQIRYAALPVVWVVELDESDVPWLVRLRVE